MWERSDDRNSENRFLQKDTLLLHQHLRAFTYIIALNFPSLYNFFRVFHFIYCFIFQKVLRGLVVFSSSLCVFYHLLRGWTIKCAVGWANASIFLRPNDMHRNNNKKKTQTILQLFDLVRLLLACTTDYYHIEQFNPFQIKTILENGIYKSEHPQMWPI